MDFNFKINQALAQSKISSITAANVSRRGEMEKGYEKMEALFAKSKCDQLDALKNHLLMEKSAVLQITNFYESVLQMMKKATEDTEQVQTNYASSTNIRSH